jgi:hypothetical protein
MAMHHRKTIVQLSSSLPIFNMEMEEGYYSYSSLCGALAVTVAGWLVYVQVDESSVQHRETPSRIHGLPPRRRDLPLLQAKPFYRHPSLLQAKAEKVLNWSFFLVETDFRPALQIKQPRAFCTCVHVCRYGPLFKTNLVGQPLVVSMDAEVNRFIFQQEGKLFRSWYPDTTNIIFGKESLASCDGSLHKFVRSFAARLFGVDSLRDVLLAEMEHNVARSFAAWAAEPAGIEVKDAVSTVILKDMHAIYSVLRLAS